MARYVVYSQPWAEIPGRTLSEEVWVLADDVIAWKRHREPRYESDEQALDDFLIVHWAEIRERD